MEKNTNSPDKSLSNHPIKISEWGYFNMFPKSNNYLRMSFCVKFKQQTKKCQLLQPITHIRHKMYPRNSCAQASGFVYSNSPESEEMKWVFPIWMCCWFLYQPSLFPGWIRFHPRWSKFSAGARKLSAFLVFCSAPGGTGHAAW